ncbi:MAG: cytidine deaminase [Rhodobacteraceae bacterium HLUCCA12]|nr:MAG: cytidine deaminase [Rhodobacteraceae bacterium HLUCCA12]
MTETVAPARIAQALEAARALIAVHGAEGRHHIAAAVLSDDGAMHLGISLESTVRWASICAEPGAVSRAMIDAPGAAIIATIAVNRDGAIVPPCSRCRELLADFAPHAQIALPDPAGWRLVALASLMPYPYKGLLRFDGDQA